VCSTTGVQPTSEPERPTRSFGGVAAAGGAKAGGARNLLYEVMWREKR
jgi:hypothetical protein